MHNQICTNCLICDEKIPVAWIHDTSPRICQKCKDAIMIIRHNYERYERCELIMDSALTIKENNYEF